MKRLLIIPVVALCALIGFTTAPAHAATSRITVPNLAAKRCSVAKERLQATLQTIQTSGDMRSLTYTQAYQSALPRVDQLKHAGYDTAALSASLAKLKDQLNTYHQASQSLYSSIDTAQLYACGESDSLFAAELQTARKDLTSARTAAQAAHQTLQTVIIPELKAAVTWLQAKSTTEAK